MTDTTTPPTVTTTTTTTTGSNNHNTTTTIHSTAPVSSPWPRYFIKIIVLPFLVGFLVTIGVSHLRSNGTLFTGSTGSTTGTAGTNTVSSSMMERILASLPSMNPHSKGTFSPKMDANRCFLTLERHMFELKQPDWDAFLVLETTPIWLHRNGQAEACGNYTFTSSTVGSGSSSSSSDTTNNNNNNTSNNNHMKTIFRSVVQDLHDLGHACPDFTNKYHVEAFLTRVLAQAIYTTTTTASSFMSPSPCHSDDDDSNQMVGPRRHLGLYDYCDMGEERTPILLDHDKLIPNTIVPSLPLLISKNDDRTHTLLPCHFHTEHGLRVTSLSQFYRLLLQSATATTKHRHGDNNDTSPTNCMVTPNGEETCWTVATTTTTNSNDDPTTNTLPSVTGLHLYAVPAGRVFMHVAAYVGQEIALDHVPGADPNQRVYLKVLSVSPAVFDLYNFFTKDESAELVQRALTETKESHRIKRSTTGTGEHLVNNHRTSESGFDTDGATSIRIKKYV